MTEPTRARVTNAEGILSIIPLVMGYQPSDGFTVMLGLASTGRLIVSMRLDAEHARRIEPDHMSTILANAQDAGVESTLIVGYGKHVTPAVDRVRDLVGQELPIRDALRVDGNRCWSYHCDDLECCPIDGREFQAETEASTTLRAEGGLIAAPSREDIAATIAAPEGEQAEAARQAWARALAEPQNYRTAKDAVVQAVADCRTGKLPEPEQAARLAAALTALPVRDYAWALSDREHAEQHTELWKSVRPQRARAGVTRACVASGFHELAGRSGASANIAVERALEANPGYSMAKLLDQALQAGVPPSQAELPMSPAEVERSYVLADPEPEVDDYQLEAS